MTTLAKQISKQADHIVDAMRGAGERIIDLKGDAAKTLDKRTTALGKLMRKHPVAAIAIGLGAGYMIARVMHRG
jgi:hypothetical protein